MSVNQNRKVLLNYNRLTANLNFTLTCRPITLWPAFSFPASKLRACFSAYLTPISIVVWKPLVFAYLQGGKIQYLVYEVCFLLLEHWFSWPRALKWYHKQVHLLRGTLCWGWEEVTVPQAICRWQPKVTQVSCQQDILQGLAFCEPPRFCVWRHSSRTRPCAVRNHGSELPAFPGGMW